MATYDCSAKRTKLQTLVARWLFERHFVSVVICYLLVLINGCRNFYENVDSIEAGRRAYLLGQYTEAERLYEEYLQKNPNGKDRWEAWNRVMDIALSVRIDNERAASLLDTMFLEFGDKADHAWLILSLLAEAYENMRQWDKAIVTWQKSLNLLCVSDSRLAEVWLRLARIFKIKRDYDLAQDALDNCRKQAKDSNTRACCIYEQSKVLEFMTNFSESRRLLQEALAMDDISDELRSLLSFMLADIYEHGHNKPEAIKLLHSIKDVHPNPRMIEMRLKYLQKTK